MYKNCSKKVLQTTNIQINELQFQFHVVPETDERGTFWLKGKKKTNQEFTQLFGL